MLYTKRIVSWMVFNYQAFLPICIRMKIYYWILFLLTAGLSCTKSNDLPTIDFSTEIEKFQVSFKPDAPKATSYKWDFGDNEFSDEKEPVHRYKYGGLYHVKLTVNTPAGTVVKEKEVRVFTPTMVRILKIKLLKYNTAIKYDSLDGPDVFLEFEGAGTKYITSTVNNVTPGNLPLTWDVTPAIEIPISTRGCILRAVDNDTPATNTAMDGYIFGFEYFAVGGYPEEAILSVSYSPFVFSMVLDWK